jgi:hypothetical protein
MTTIEQRLQAIEEGQNRIESILTQLLSAIMDEEQDPDEPSIDLNGQPTGRARDETQEL